MVSRARSAMLELGQTRQILRSCRLKFRAEHRCYPSKKQWDNRPIRYWEGTEALLGRVFCLEPP